MKKEKVYEVIGRMSGMRDLSLQTKFVIAISIKDAKNESHFDYIKSIYLRKDLKCIK